MRPVLLPAPFMRGLGIGRWPSIEAERGNLWENERMSGKMRHEVRNKVDGGIC